MSRSVGRLLPGPLRDRLSQGELKRHVGTALPLITIDETGHPHPMILSYVEVRAIDAGSVAVVLARGSRSTRNLGERQAATLLVVDEETTAYVKLTVVDGPLDVGGQPGLGLFLLAVDDVLEDSPAGWEAGMRITSGIRYGPAPTLEEAWARDVLAALTSPCPRA
jgi:hypothetical protein